MQIYVRTLSPIGTLTLDVNPSDTVESLKVMIHEKNGLPPSQFDLISDRFFKRLKEVRRTLSHYNILHESTLHVVLASTRPETEVTRSSEATTSSSSDMPAASSSEVAAFSSSEKVAVASLVVPNVSFESTNESELTAAGTPEAVVCSIRRCSRECNSHQVGTGAIVATSVASSNMNAPLATVIDSTVNAVSTYKPDPGASRINAGRHYSQPGAFRVGGTLERTLSETHDTVRVSESLESIVAKLDQDLYCSDEVKVISTESLESVGELVQDLSCSDDVKVIFALDALRVGLVKDSKKCKNILIAGGSFALVQLVRDLLKKAITKFPACHQVVELNGVELQTLDKSMRVIISLTRHLAESRSGICSIGGAEAVVEVMKTFPQCQVLQGTACGVLINLADCSIGKKKAIDKGGIEVLLSAVKNHLSSADICERACWALSNIVTGSKENAELLISLGGSAAVAKMRLEWPNNAKVQALVQKVTRLILDYTKTWIPESVEMGGVRKLIKDLFRSSNTEINAGLVALRVDLYKDKDKCDIFTYLGGCDALVQLAKNCLEKAKRIIPACDQVANLIELAELTTLDKTFRAITNLTYHNEASSSGIIVIGGAEVVVDVMKTFPKCQVLQESSCDILNNLACCSIGKNKTVEMGGIEVAMAALSNHLDSAIACEWACWALVNMVKESKENIALCISLGGGAVVPKVKNKWPYNEKVYSGVQQLAKLIRDEMKTWIPE
jgi:hypothetical protein